MLASSAARLTRRLTTQWSCAVAAAVSAHPPPVFRGMTGSTVTAALVARNTTMVMPTGAFSHYLLSTRSFATDTKGASVTQENDKKEQPTLQHQEWVKFQKSIQVDGFHTGQVTTALVAKKSKGGKQARNRKQRELERQQAMDPNFVSSSSRSASKFPALQYSPEETKELLDLAYATLPKRDGKRGTRNLKRQARRWKLVREIRYKYKKHIMAAHERRMLHRKWKRDQTKAVKEAAPTICQTDKQYQAQNLQRWATTMYPAAAAVGSDQTTGKMASASAGES